MTLGDAAEREQLAKMLHASYSAWRLEAENVATPRWFALREDYKDQFREAARLLTVDLDATPPVDDEERQRAWTVLICAHCNRVDPECSCDSELTEYEDHRLVPESALIEAREANARLNELFDHWSKRAVDLSVELSAEREKVRKLEEAAVHMLSAYLADWKDLKAWARGLLEPLKALNVAVESPTARSALARFTSENRE